MNHHQNDLESEQPTPLGVDEGIILGSDLGEVLGSTLGASDGTEI